MAFLRCRLGLSRRATASLTRLAAALAAEPNPATTITDTLDVIDRHLADSLSGLEIRQVREARRIADVGSGAGFPGLPLACALPDAHVDLIEANRRKTEAISRLITAVGLDNAEVAAARTEEWGAGPQAGSYDAVVVRAVGALPVLVEYAAPLLHESGVLVAWKGARDVDEEAAGAAAGSILDMRPIEVVKVTPYVEARNLHLHVYRKTGPTPEGFPRRPGMAAKRPLGT